MVSQNDRNPTKRIGYLLRLVAMIACWVGVIGTPLYAQTTPDAELYNRGYNAYRNRQWVQAAMNLKAYVERNPDAMRTNATHRNEVLTALRFAEEQASYCLQRLPTVINQLNQCRQASSGVGSSVSGLTQAPPELRPLETQEPMVNTRMCSLFPSTFVGRAARQTAMGLKRSCKALTRMPQLIISRLSILLRIVTDLHSF